MSGISSNTYTNQFSFKRYFINNVDSYQGGYYLRQISKVLEGNVGSTRATSQTVVGEHMEVLPPPPEPVYEIIGTVTDPSINKIENVARIIPNDQALAQMLTCGYVILDITNCSKEELKIASDYVKAVKDLLVKTSSPEADAAAGDASSMGGAATVDTPRRYLILVSTVMTWACTKPLDPESPDMAFVEMDFRKRKPHPNYKIHYDIENEVVLLARKHRQQIGAIVVNAGVTYGGKEDVLFYWFQKAWECDPTLPILGKGNNIIPLINVVDLASIVYNLVTDFPKKLYILAVEQNLTKQREIIKPLGRAAGSGLFQCIPPEDAFLIPDIDQRIFDLMTLNISMEPSFIVETMGLQWTSELSFAENVPLLIKQFKKERALKPFKVIIYGPPLVGKTTVSKRVCELYGLVYVSPETVVDDIANELAFKVSHWERGEQALLPMPAVDDEEQLPPTDDEEEPVEDEAVQENARQTLALLQSGKPLNEEEILGFLRQRLLNRDAQNRGWVLDGFPTNLSECTDLFQKGEEPDEVEEEGREEPFEEDMELYSAVLKKLLPDIVVYLDATDDFICDKAMQQPEGDPRFQEDVVLKRLGDFRIADARDVTPLNFFDELDIHPLVVPIQDHMDYDMEKAFKEVTLRMGQPCAYGKLLALIEEANKKAKKEYETLRAKEAKAKAELEERLQHEREDKMEYWSELYAAIREEEEAALAAAGEPMRHYLVHHIFPTLTPALLEVAKVRPADPVDYLAEHLFKLNPSGKMLEPGYNLQAEKLFGKIRILDDALQDLDIQIDPLIPPEADIAETSKTT